MWPHRLIACSALALVCLAGLQPADAGFCWGWSAFSATLKVWGAMAGVSDRSGPRLWRRRRSDS